MKKLLILIAIPFALASCIKQLDKTFQGKTVVEFDATPLNSVATGVNYPVLTRIPDGGRPLVVNRDSTLRRWNGTIRLRVNLVGPQMNQDQTVGYKIFTQSPVTTIFYDTTLVPSTFHPGVVQLPKTRKETLNVVPAIEGTDFEALSGKITIPANSSYGYIDLKIINHGATAGQARFLGFSLDSTGTVLPNPNYNKLGITIDQR